MKITLLYLFLVLSIFSTSLITQAQSLVQPRIWSKPLVMSPRQILVYQAKIMVKEFEHLPYIFGSADPKNGGFDCSGAMYFVMMRCGLKPPRSSAQQYIWIRDNAKIHEVGKNVETFDDPAFKYLRMGDLLFWSGTYAHNDGRKVNISHVGIYLGKEADGKRIMACASEGRSYKGIKGNGYGVYDFKLPPKTSKSTFVGYGSIPGMQ